jgi:hypothetical protein
VIGAAVTQTRARLRTRGGGLRVSTIPLVQTAVAAGIAWVYAVRNVRVLARAARTALEAGDEVPPGLVDERQEVRHIRAAVRRLR